MSNPTGTHHEAVSPQITGVPSPQPGPVSPQITGVTNPQANGATHDVKPAQIPQITGTTTSDPPRETVESMGSGIEVVPDNQPPSYVGKCEYLLKQMLLQQNSKLMHAAIGRHDNTIVLLRWARELVQRGLGEKLVAFPELLTLRL